MAIRQAIIMDVPSAYLPANIVVAKKHSGSKITTRRHATVFLDSTTQNLRFKIER